MKNIWFRHPLLNSSWKTNQIMNNHIKYLLKLIGATNKETDLARYIKETLPPTINNLLIVIILINPMYNNTL
jgi:hypothetical protein